MQLKFAETSEAFTYNELYIIANITYNDSLVKKWILNEFVDVIRA